MNRKTAILVLAAALTMSACSVRSETSKPENGETAAPSVTESVETEKQDRPETSAAPNTEESVSAFSETETAYWELLCEEYDKEYDHTIQLSAFEDGVLYAYVMLDGISGFIVYDTVSGEITYPDYNELFYYETYIYNGNIYCNNYTGEDLLTTVRRYDLQGNLLAESEPLCGMYTLVGDGEVIAYIDKGLYRFSPDLSETEPLILTVADGQGNTETVDPTGLFWVYGTKMYFTRGSNSYVGDIDTGELEILDYYVGIGFLGKYFFSGEDIYDIETGETITGFAPTAITPDGVMRGHRQFHECVNGDGLTEVYDCVLPESLAELSGSREEIIKAREEYIKEYGTLVYTSKRELESYGIWYINDDYIAVRDDTGDYLVNIGTGEEKELNLNDRELNIELSY